MGLLDLFKRKDSVPEKVESCEKTDSAANAVKEIRDKILQKTAIPCMKLELTDTKPGLFDSKVGGVGYVPRDAKIPEDSEGTQLRLLAQINCAEITLEDFPRQGLLQFWILNDDASGLNFTDITLQDTFRVLYYKEPDRTVTEKEVCEKMQDVSSDEEDYFPVRGCYGLAFSADMDTISSSDYRFENCIKKLVRQDYPEKAEQLLESYAEEGTDESLRFDCASLLMELAGEEDDTLMMDQMYQLGMKLKPDNTSIYSKYGRVLIMNGRYADAVDAYKKAVNLNKETNYYGELLQALYLRDGEIKSEYAEYLSKAVIPEEDRKTPLDYIKLARYCRVIGDYADAEKYLKQAVTMKLCSSCGYHGCEEGYYELGILYEVMGEREKAIEAYEKAIEAHGHCYVYEKRLQDLLKNS